MNDGWIRADWAAPAGVLAGTTTRNADFDTLDIPGQPCWLTQVHGAEVVEAGHFDAPPEADGSISHDPAFVAVVRTADCLPLLFCSTDGTEVAAVHAGWRGLAGGVIEAAVRRLRTDPGEMLVWLGPAISQPAYEVGAEVRDAFVSQDAAAADCFRPNDRGRWQADLYGLARRRLAALGISSVSGGGFCTFADRDRFFSYRRDGSSGRMLSFIARIP